ncbi:MAG: hydrolase [Candidatus Marinimicrobia bacterium]|nr:hydrolase [Candidatus Neomarinimicrobiota bacterium]|tara:strand:- start:23 stop:550 length:528 start_codon:yes stop_codon:yes gene_type:complete
MKKVLTLIDVQEKLVPLMENKNQFIKNLIILLKGAQLFKIPIIWMEQLPEKLGATISEVIEVMAEKNPIVKNVFSCCNSDNYNDVLIQHDPDEIILCGIETHVCVYQTASDLLAKGKNVQIVVDAVTSRKKLNHDIGLQRISEKGGTLSTCEQFLFEEQKIAEGDRFRALIKLVR